ALSRVQVTGEWGDGVADTRRAGSGSCVGMEHVGCLRTEHAPRWDRGGRASGAGALGAAAGTTAARAATAATAATTAPATGPRRPRGSAAGTRRAVTARAVRRSAVAT